MGLYNEELKLKETPYNTINSVYLKDEGFLPCGIKYTFEPSTNSKETQICVGVDNFPIRKSKVNKMMVDVAYDIENRQYFTGDSNNLFNCEISKEEGGTTSYYFSQDGNVDVMTVEGDNVTEESIRQACEKMIVQMKAEGIL